MTQLCIVLPCYNEEDALPATCRYLADLLTRLAAMGLVSKDSSILFVDDGSRDRSWEILEALHAQDPRFRAMRLSRNYGHQNALLAGLLACGADVVVSMDADLQDDPEAVIKMLQMHAQGYDIVNGVRENRESDSSFKRLSAELYYRLLHLLGAKVVYNHADYRLMSRRAVDALRGFQEVNLFLRGIIPMLGFRTTTVSYVRHARQAGESKYPMRKMLSLALQGVTSFSSAPLHMITLLGALVSLVSLGLGIWSICIRLFTDQALPGWASTVVPIYFLGGVQLLCLGIMGEYMAKIFGEVKQRPRYIIEKTLG